MKKVFLMLLVCSFSVVSPAQTVKPVQVTSSAKASVEKSVFGIQTGYLGIWVNNEARLSNSFALRSEIGFTAQIWNSSFEKAGYLLTPVIRLEPRWYYNLRKRKSRSKRIDGNSGNFLSLQTSFYPGGRAISNYDNVNINPFLTVAILWGMRRDIGRHFNFELGVGPEYAHNYPDRKGYGKSDNFGLAFLIRIGYRF